MHDRTQRELNELPPDERLRKGRDERGRYAPGNTQGFVPGRSGNPGGRPKGASFASALARQAVALVSDREEMARIARMIGIDPEDARNIDVVAALFYVVLSRSDVGMSPGRILGVETLKTPVGRTAVAKMVGISGLTRRFRVVILRGVCVFSGMTGPDPSEANVVSIRSGLGTS